MQRRWGMKIDDLEKSDKIKSKLARIYASKIGLPSIEGICVLLHDLGKYSQEFQDYINSALGNNDSDADECVDVNSKKGKIISNVYNLLVSLKRVNFFDITRGMVVVLIVNHAIERYFKYYFLNRKILMSCPFFSKKTVQKYTLLEMLSKNKKAVRIHNNFEPLPQSFTTAGKLFEVIESLTQSIIVPYEEGKEIIISPYASKDI